MPLEGNGPPMHPANQRRDDRQQQRRRSWGRRLAIWGGVIGVIAMLVVATVVTLFYIDSKRPELRQEQAPSSLMNPTDRTKAVTLYVSFSTGASEVVTVPPGTPVVMKCYVDTPASGQWFFVGLADTAANTYGYVPAAQILNQRRTDRCGAGNPP